MFHFLQNYMNNRYDYGRIVRQYSHDKNTKKNIDVVIIVGLFLLYTGPIFRGKFSRVSLCFFIRLCYAPCATIVTILTPTLAEFRHAELRWGASSEGVSMVTGIRGSIIYYQSGIRRRNEYIIGFIALAIGPNKSRKLTRLIAPAHNIHGKVWVKKNTHGFTEDNFAAYIVCRRFKPCEFLGYVWTDCWGNKSYYVITSPANKPPGSRTSCRKYISSEVMAVTAANVLEFPHLIID